MSHHVFDEMFGYSNNSICSNSDLSLKKILTNSTDIAVKDFPGWICPSTGDKVEIVSYDTQKDVQECVKVSKLPYCTVKEVYPHIVGVGNDKYCWAYEISIEESHLRFLQYHYKVISNPNP